MATINLAPETQYLLEQKKRQRLLFLAAAGIVILLLLVWGALTVTRSYVRGQLQAVQAEITAVETKIAELDAVAKRIVLFERRSNALQQLLAARVSWDSLLKELERLLPPPTTLNQLVVAAGGTVEIVGHTPDLDVLAQTLASLQNTASHATLFQKSNLKGASRQAATAEGVPAGYNFIAHFTFDPARLQP